MYSPKDLPEGRQSLHDDREVIASNHVGIIDARTLLGTAQVCHFDMGAATTRHFWRSYYDAYEKRLYGSDDFCVTLHG